MGEVLAKAFRKREGRQDHKSFIEVVNAFFQELRDDTPVIVPVNLNEKGWRPQLMPMPDGKYALIVVTDEAHLSNFKEKSNVGMSPKNLVQIMKEYGNVGGIIINPFSMSNCFLPKYDVLGFLNQMGYKI